MESLWTWLAHARDDLEDLKRGERTKCEKRIVKIDENDAEEAALKAIANKKHLNDRHSLKYINIVEDLSRRNAIYIL
ncbi:unnamed protein product [Didymodactylos carnosus]|uniref:Uncharacterized protein n=1 Tax=Didymodactylos carnosus TaxID=1234261 RepID=A0A815GMS3_9BILA|nr:unnamed protein product [Didymodactylos carnosus]CAF4200953.1 unnamed protein product [Didymodactylos carnosus]